MGGGPRTFQGGLSKWQHRRMHEKLALQKERGLLRHEKQLYLARLRSEIRASHLPGTTNTTTSSRSHVQALADRFLRPGAEDLWNEDDGPLRRARQPLPHPLSARILPSEDPRAERGTGKERQLLSTLSPRRVLNHRRSYGTVAPCPWWWHRGSASHTPLQE